MFTLGPFATNCYMVWRDGAPDCWIIDASFKPQPIVDAVREAGLTPTLLILTHAHLDHMAGVEELRSALPGLPVVIHEAEADWLTDPNLNMSILFGLPVVTGPADRLLRDGDELELCGTTFSILHTPGHSPGGICLYSAAEGVAFVGDALFHDSIGRTDFPNADHATLLESIRDKLLLLPDETRIYPGHGPDSTIGREKRHNPFL